jgi:NhaA family Na+:H+ antiporter
MTRLANSSVSVAERLQHALHPVTSFLVVPLFALANAGVVLEREALRAPGSGRVALGIALGLVLGKTAGIAGAARLAVGLGLSPLPEGGTWRQLVGIAAMAGIGFTVSLFIAALAFPDPRLEAAAKIGILAGSVLASGIGLLVLALAAKASPNRS